jgi:hypothetical protein
MSESKELRRAIDDEHLKILSLFYYILGGINAFFAFIPCIHMSIGLMLILMSSSMHNKPGEPPAAVIGVMLLFIGVFIFLLLAGMAALKIAAGRCIAKRKNKALIYITAALSCLSIPFGLVLGIFTFVVLSRPTVMEQFSADR